jgi:hypothetical protein
VEDVSGNCANCANPKSSHEMGIERIHWSGPQN